MCFGGSDFSVSPYSLVKKSHLPALFWVPARNVAALFLSRWKNKLINFDLYFCWFWYFQKRQKNKV